MDRVTMDSPIHSLSSIVVSFFQKLMDSYASFVFELRSSKILKTGLHSMQSNVETGQM